MSYRRAPLHSRATHAPRIPRRVSGPLRGAAAGASAAGGTVAAPAPSRRRTGAFERIKALPDHGFIDRLLRGRVWIWMIGLGLLGIVFMQVWMLKLNTGISRAVQASATLERQNADLEASIARLSSGERIRAAAAKRGMVMPPAGSVRYVTARPDSDAARAVARMRAPSDEAKALMANGGITPAAAALVQSAPLQQQTAATAPGATAPGATATAPAATAPAATAPAATAPGTTAPAATAPGTTTTATAPGAATGTTATTQGTAAGAATAPPAGQGG